MSESEPCRFVSRCPMFGEFTTQATLRIFQIHYCHGDHDRCERKKRASAGEMPPADLLPDGGLLRRNRRRVGESNEGGNSAVG